MPRYLFRPVDERDHSRGVQDAPACVVFYGDFACAQSRLAHVVLASVRDFFGAQMRIVFRNFPQSQTHPGALEERHLFSYARRLALDVDKFERSFRNETMLGRIKADFSGGVRSGVDGTPALFINGERYEGLIEEEALVAAIDEHIASRTARAAAILGGVGRTSPPPDSTR